MNCTYVHDCAHRNEAHSGQSETVYVGLKSGCRREEVEYGNRLEEIERSMCDKQYMKFSKKGATINH